jgi:hypothetical protein
MGQSESDDSLGNLYEFRNTHLGAELIFFHGVVTRVVTSCMTSLLYWRIRLRRSARVAASVIV